MARQQKERRKRPRVNTPHFVTVVDAETGQPLGRLVNVTADGIMLVTETPIMPFRDFELRLLLPRMIGDRLEMMADTGIDGIDTLDPPPLGSVDLQDAKRRVGNRVFFKGNIDSVNTLLHKSRQEVLDDALWRLQVGSPGSGMILSSACSVAPAVAPENLAALVEASEQFGPVTV